MWMLNLIYELTISERDLRSEGCPCSEKFLKAIHVVASMAKSNKSEAEILSYLEEFYAMDLKDLGKFSILKHRLKL